MKSEFKGTPGPWRYPEPYYGSLPLLNLVCSDDKGPAHADRTREEAEANARLCAASPELLDKLLALLTAVTYSAPPVDFGAPGDPNPGYEARIPVAFVDEARAVIAKALGDQKTNTPQ